jgi:hypothetical protein
MTFKELQKVVQSQSTTREQTQLFERLRSKPIWIWSQRQHKQQDIKTKGECCYFNHIMDLSIKERRKINQCLIMNCQFTNAILMTQIG